MTGAGAISQFANRVPHVRVLLLLVRTGLVVSSMATRTIGLEGRIAPVDGLGVVLVARRTQQVGAMIQRLVWQTCVHVGMRNPGHSVVTFIALPW